MKPEEIIAQAKRILEIQVGRNSVASGWLAEAIDFLRIYAGKESAFYGNLSSVERYSNATYIKEQIDSNLQALIRFVESGLLKSISIKREAEIDVVSDFLSQAATLLENTEVHPVAPTVIIGAALEEFLRNWVEELNYPLGDKKPCLNTYAEILRGEDKITKQDMKDITSWSGLRNDAAHGKWDNVEDKGKISLMLQGVNLFMRKYTK